jgi:hypothetical protein
MSDDGAVRAYVDQLLQGFRIGFEPYVIAALQRTYADEWRRVVARTPNLRMQIHNDVMAFDATALVRLMTAHWEACFARTMTLADRSLVLEVRSIRNRWAHHGKITPYDVVRLADTIVRLLQVIQAPNLAAMMLLRDEIGARYYAPPSRWQAVMARSAWLFVGVILCGGIVLAWMGMNWWMPTTSFEAPPLVIETPRALTPLRKVEPLVVVVTATILPITSTATPPGGTPTPDSAMLASFPCLPQQIKGNGDTMIYHLPDGAYYAVTRNDSVVCFDNENEALAAGYRKSKR